MKLSELSGEWPELAGNTVLSLSGVALVYSLLYVHPVAYVYFVTEDYWAEWGTFVGWAMAFCLLAWMLVKHKGARRPGLFLLALATFFVGIEEISWGQRILGIRAPEFFAERNIKGEINIHNLTTEGQHFHLVVGIVVFLFSILLPLFARRSAPVHRWCSRLGIPIVPIPLMPFFLGAIYFFMMPSLKKSEVAELYLSTASAALSLDLALTARRGASPRGAIASGATAGMILVLGILTAGLVQFYPWPERLRYNLNTVAASSFPAAGMLRQAKLLSDYMNQDPQFLGVERYTDQAAQLMRMGRHAEAIQIIEAALVEQEQLQRRHPDHPIPRRVAGQLLTVLGRPQQAERAFQEAIEKDRARLDRVTDNAAKAWVHFSLGETLLARGDIEAAAKEFSIAGALAPDRRTLYEMDYIVKRRVKRTVVAR